MEEIQTKLDNDEFELTEEYISYFDLVSNSYAISFSFNENSNSGDAPIHKPVR